MTASDGIVGGVRVSAATTERLRRHVAELFRWNRAINLVAASTLPEAWERHVEDSAQLVQHAPLEPRHWADLGSGAGFPGLVVAIILSEMSPNTRVTLVESDRRKATFLREVVRLLDLTTTIMAVRIDEAPPLRADVVSARALAPLVSLLPMAQRHLAPGGVLLFPKGSNAENELAAATAAWSFSAERLPSRTSATAEVLRVKGLNHV
jgi:16S rRNA (guanine527-N7)-methyltransferase